MLTEPEPAQGDFFGAPEHSIDDIPSDQMESWVAQHVPQLQERLLDLQERQGADWLMGKSVGELLPDSQQLVGHDISVAAHAGTDGSITVLRVVPPRNIGISRTTVRVIRLKYADTKDDPELAGVSTGVYQLEVSRDEAILDDRDAPGEAGFVLKTISGRLDHTDGVDIRDLTPDEILQRAGITEVISGDDPRSRDANWGHFARGVLGVLNDNRDERGQ